jgi:AraC-like DNA-binding protein
MRGIAMYEENTRAQEDFPTTFNLFEEQYDCIRAGDVETLDEFIRSGAISDYNHRIMTDIDTARDMFIFNLAHCHAIATAAGIPIASLYPTLRKCIASSRTATDIDELSDGIEDVMRAFAIFVRSHSDVAASRQVRDAKEYILGHVYERIRIADIADHCFMSVSGLEHRFKEETGEPISAAIEHEKVKKACQLLRRGDISCTEIAHKLGYCSQSHFIARFKSVMGTTPLKYRKNYETLRAGKDPDREVRDSQKPSREEREGFSRQVGRKRPVA